MDFKFNFGASEESFKFNFGTESEENDEQHHVKNQSNNKEKLREKPLRDCIRHQKEDTPLCSDALTVEHFNKIEIGSSTLYYLKADIAEHSVQSQEIYPLLQSSDLQSGEYEGGLKVWECTLDLLNYLHAKKYPLDGKNVLDLGCGAGLLGLFSYLNGASNVCLQDYNSEVIENFSIPSVEYTLNDSIDKTENRDKVINSETTSRPTNKIEEYDDTTEEEHKVNKTFSCNKEKDSTETNLNNKFVFLSGDWSSVSTYFTCNNYRKFDLMLSSETIYNVDYYYKLKDVLQHHLSDGGVALFAAKKHYFGVGGGTQDFIEYFTQDDQFDVCIV